MYSCRHGRLVLLLLMVCFVVNVDVIGFVIVVVVVVVAIVSFTVVGLFFCDSIPFDLIELN